jgi:hypothetical protein
MPLLRMALHRPPSLTLNYRRPRTVFKETALLTKGCNAEARIEALVVVRWD